MESNRPSGLMSYMSIYQQLVLCIELKAQVKSTLLSALKVDFIEKLCLFTLLIEWFNKFFYP